MAERIDTSGLTAAFKELREDLHKRTARRMVGAGAKVVREEAKRIAAAAGLRRTGALLNNIVMKRERTPEGIEQYNLGVRHGRALGKKAEKKLVVGANGRIQTRYVNDPWYWVILEVGAKPHVIAPAKGGKLLVWTQVPRPTQFARKVNHPGTQATPFLAPALENKRDAALEVMAQRLEAAIKKANKA
ncbi:HK97-gp10 family putative phage morphogenesis protein [Noviherbaspirillum malthae]|uniref:HK97-gp10 family putative phage morphogenesis protein n=1 Tax=Noviherbaspirillum malthae TaxID=1260987 RepID=UPI00188F7779|nr:HK97-gp10 family putative phage morphogenesis protein [Noviherbaspirillum malthae]